MLSLRRLVSRTRERDANFTSGAVELDALDQQPEQPLPFYQP
ncbi:MAG: hypothetical protein R3C18_08440 [Planctomycetaceae bacterium]